MRPKPGTSAARLIENGFHLQVGRAGHLERELAHWERLPALRDNAGVGRDNPYKSDFIVGFTLSDEERTDVIAFLESLTDASFVSDERFSDPWPTP